MCRKCGGKNLPPEKSSHTSDGSSFSDGSVELVLLAGLTACLLGVFIYAGDRPYKYLYLMGFVCGLYTLRDVYDRLTSMPS